MLNCKWHDIHKINTGSNAVFITLKHVNYSTEFENYSSNVKRAALDPHILVQKLWKYSISCHFRSIIWWLPVNRSLSLCWHNYKIIRTSSNVALFFKMLTAFPFNSWMIGCQSCRLNLIEMRQGIFSWILDMVEIVSLSAMLDAGCLQYHKWSDQTQPSINININMIKTLTYWLLTLDFHIVIRDMFGPGLLSIGVAAG